MYVLLFHYDSCNAVLYASLLVGHWYKHKRYRTV